jgi:hypothetical protein
MAAQLAASQEGLSSVRKQASSIIFFTKPKTYQPPLVQFNGNMMISWKEENRVLAEILSQLSVENGNLYIKKIYYDSQCPGRVSNQALPNEFIILPLGFVTVYTEGPTQSFHRNFLGLSCHSIRWLWHSCD